MTFHPRVERERKRRDFPLFLPQFRRPGNGGACNKQANVRGGGRGVLPPPFLNPNRPLKSFSPSPPLSFLLYLSFAP